MSGLGPSSRRVLVVGAGSIGRRHIGNLRTLGVDVLAYRYREQLADELGVLGAEVVPSVEDGLARRPDAVVVCNRTDQHLAAALAAARAGIPLFIEKPIAASLDHVSELVEITRSRGLVVEVGCMMRFHPNLRDIRSVITDGILGKIWHVRAWVGFSLPLWRPDADYRESYSARSAAGGGVLLDLIHEPDYLRWLFGEVSSLRAIIDRVSDLEIDCEDVAHILLRFESGVVGHIALDYLSPVYRRGCEIVGRGGVLSWDYVSGRAELHTATGTREISRVPAGFERNRMYLEHMAWFLARLSSPALPAACALDEGVRDLEIVAAARSAAASGCAVDIAEVRHT